MTGRFGMGYGQMGFGGMPSGPTGFGPQTSGMGPGQYCPTCGVQMGYPMMGMQQFMPGMTPWMGPQFMPGMAPQQPWMGMPQYWGGMMPPTGFPGYAYGPGYPGVAPGYGPTYQTMTVPDDEQIREMIYDAIDADPLVPYESDVNVEVTGGLVTLTGTVPNKRIKHSIGDDSWWIPGVWDVNNQLQVAGRARPERAPEGPRMPPTTRQRPRRPTGQT